MTLRRRQAAPDWPCNELLYLVKGALDVIIRKERRHPEPLCTRKHGIELSQRLYLLVHVLLFSAIVDKGVKQFCQGNQTFRLRNNKALEWPFYTIVRKQ